MKTLLQKISSGMLVLLLIGSFSFVDLFAEEDYQHYDGFDYLNYNQLEYVDVPIGAYINTDVPTNSIQEFSITFKNKSDSFRRLFGSVDSSSRFQMTFPNDNNQADLFILNKHYYFDYDNNSIYNVSYSNKNFKFNDFSLNVDLSQFSNLNFYLFSLNNNGSSNYPGNKYCYSYSVNNKLYIPSQNISTLEVGFYCVNDGSFIQSSSSTQFIAGPIIPPLKYSVSHKYFSNGSVSGYGDYVAGSSVELVATAYRNFEFVKWSDGSTDNPYSFTLTSDKVITPLFQRITTSTEAVLDLSVNHNYYGSVNGGGTYAIGTKVRISAVPNEGYIFSHWSDNDSTNPRNIDLLENLSLQAIFVPVYSEFEDFELDHDSLITWNGNYYDLRMVTHKRRLIDQTINLLSYLQFDMTGSLNTTVGLVGTYYDNTIQGLEYCNGVSVTTNTSTNVNNFYDWLRSNGFSVYSSNGVMLLAHSSGGGGPTSPPSGMSGSVSVEQMGCKLLATDGKTNVLEHLEELGYVKKPIDISDGGYAETYVYVPGNEAINLNFSNLSSFVTNMFDQLRAYSVNRYIVEYHYEKDFKLMASPGVIFPYSGKFEFNIPLYVLNDYYLEDLYFTDRYSIPVFKVKDTNGILKGNNIVWWNNVDYLNITYETDHYFGVISKIDENPVDTSSVIGGWKYNSWFESYPFFDQNVYNKQFGSNGNDIFHVNTEFYEYYNGSTLGLFNSLGRFFNDWFNKFYIFISGNNISDGGNEYFIQNDINNNYNVNIDTDIHDLIHDVNAGLDDINPLISDNELSVDHKNGLAALGSAILDPLFGIFFDSGIGYMIVIPIVLLLLGLIL